MTAPVRDAPTTAVSDDALRLRMMARSLTVETTDADGRGARQHFATAASRDEYLARAARTPGMSARIAGQQS